ncbi:MAG: FAD:protein FMN transferase [Candidatus Bipolaricaulia bacterium]
MIRWWPLLLVALLATAFAIETTLFGPTAQPFQAHREMMDTWVSITVYDTDESHAKSAIDAAFSRMEEVVRIASIHDPEAEAFRLNVEGIATSPSPELFELLLASKRIFEISGGVFDVTVAPLLALWQFHPAAQMQFWELAQEDQQAAIDETMKLVGTDRISLIEDPEPTVELARGTQITLGGIAKGYIVDQGLRALRAEGIVHALIDAGGDIAVFGGKPGDAKWEIALVNPADEEDALAHFALEDGAIATSGNYRRFFDPEAQVGHIMDPRTGYSSEASSSATVIAATCMEADALATAVFVLGPEEGIELVNGLTAVEAMVLGHEDPTAIVRSRNLGDYEVRKKDGV